MYKNKLKQDAVIALKSGDKRAVDALRYLVSLIDKKEMLLPPGEMKEEDELIVMRKELKNKEEARKMFFDGGRQDLVEQLDYEIDLLKKYLPVDMGEDEIVKIVEDVVASAPGANFGMVMGLVMKKVAGKVGGETVTRIVKEKLDNR